MWLLPPQSSLSSRSAPRWICGSVSRARARWSGPPALDAARDILADDPDLPDAVSRVAAEAIEAYAPELFNVIPLAAPASRRRPRGAQGGWRHDDPSTTARPAVPPLTRPEMGLAGVGALAAAGVGALGLISSFDAVSAAAARWGFASPWMLPVGIDVAIPVFTVANLLLIRMDMALAWVRFVPWVLTLITCGLNVAAGHGVWAKVAHGTMPLLWVVFSEIGAHIYAVADRRGDRPPHGEDPLLPLAAGLPLHLRAVAPDDAVGGHLLPGRTGAGEGAAVGPRGPARALRPSVALEDPAARARAAASWANSPPPPRRTLPARTRAGAAGAEGEPKAAPAPPDHRQGQGQGTAHRRGAAGRGARRPRPIGRMRS